jgi:hypothetical protein
MKSLLSLTAIIVVAQTSFAGNCELTIDRKACAGKETEALKPYDGKNPTSEKSLATDPDACMKKAEKTSRIIRKGTLMQKTVSGKFDGKALEKSFTDKADCNK